LVRNFSAIVVFRVPYSIQLTRKREDHKFLGLRAARSADTGDAKKGYRGVAGRKVEESGAPTALDHTIERSA